MTRYSGLFDIARSLLTIPLSSERFFGAPLFTGFQVERVTLDFLHDVFLLNLAFKTTQSAFERLSILEMDFCQTNSPAFRESRASRERPIPLVYPL